jgi:hypothetical protein
MKQLINRAVRYFMRRGWQEGVIEGNQVWIIVGGAALLAHLAGRAMRRQPDLVFSELLEPGQSFIISNEPRS